MSNSFGNQIDVVLKLAERCNLACPYCYYFFQENKLSEISRPLIPEKTVHVLAAFLKKGAQELDIKHISWGCTVVNRRCCRRHVSTACVPSCAKHSMVSPNCILNADQRHARRR